MNDADHFHEFQGYLWPNGDQGLKAVWATYGRDLPFAYKHCRNFQVAVQAGGCIGLWPKAMAEKFKFVYTFEPDPRNFRCLIENAPDLRILKFNAALGDVHGCVDLVRRAENCGAHFVDPATLDAPDQANYIPTLRIDDLALPFCDLIYLDIEGREFAALNGAVGTIKRHKPVVVIEDKGMSDKYGIKVGGTGDWLREHFGYREVDRVSRDVVYAP